MRKIPGLLGLLATILILPSGGVAQQPVRWEATLDSAQRLAGQTNRLVLIHFWAPWCAVCKRMDGDVLNQPSVAAELAAHYVPVRINADYFPATARQYGVTALPTTVIATPQGQPLDVMRGRVETGDYVARLARVAAEVKQRSGAVYAQMPTGSVPPPAAAQPPTAAVAPPANTPAPPLNTPAPLATANAPMPGDGGPALTAGSQPSGPAGPADNRYADFFRRSQADPVGPIPQPSTALAGPTDARAPTNYAPSPAPAAPALPYQSQSPPPAAQSPAGAVAQMASRGPAAQLPPINPPLGLDGYCPVVLSERQQWVLGDRRWGAVHRGRTYLFTGPEEQRRFFSDPDRYAPAISGNDVVLATERGQAMPGMREHGVFFGNRVYLFLDEGTLEKFSRNPSLYANQALGAIRTGAYAGQPRQ